MATLVRMLLGRASRAPVRPLDADLGADRLRALADVLARRLLAGAPHPLPVVAGADLPPRSARLWAPPAMAMSAADVPAAGTGTVAAPGAAVGEAEAVDAAVLDEVRLAQQGNAHAFSLLYDRYVDKVFAYVYHRVGDVQTAEDLTADVFTRALTRIGTFRWQGKDFGAWLVAIARNRCHDHFKSARFRLESAVAEVYDDADAAPAYDARPERELELADLREAVHAALGQLKAEQAEVLYHRFLQGYDVAATAAVMGKKEGAIRALQYRALKALAAHVDTEALL